MKIVLATPLYPPEIATPAPYVKELAKRLSSEHSVTVVAYAHLPEQVQNVSIVAVDKRRPLVVRLALYTAALWSAARGADVLYTQNGAAAELPAALVSFIQRKPLVLCMGDTLAKQKARHSRLLSFIQYLAISRASRVVLELPSQRPEILPFVPRPEKEFDDYTRSWDEHLAQLSDIFTHAKR